MNGTYVATVRETIPCSASSIWLSTRHCPHFLLNAVLRRHCCRVPCQSICPARGTLSSKPAAHCNNGTDGRTSDRYIDPDLHTMWEALIIVTNEVHECNDKNSRSRGTFIVTHPRSQINSTTWTQHAT